MNGKTAKLISPERVRQLFECYGSNPDSWPLDEKVAALSLIQHSSELQELQKETSRFDEILNGYDVSNEIEVDVNQDLLASIVNALPEQEARKNSQYSNRKREDKHRFFDFNRTIGAVAASVAVMVITFSIMTLAPETTHNRSANLASQAELDGWMWQQVAGEPAEDFDEPLTMMALLELEE